MIEDALMGIEFTPDSTEAKMSFENEDTRSTQPGCGDLSRPPPTPGSDILIRGALETPRYFHGAPSPLPSLVAPRVLDPPAAPPQATNDFLHNSPLPPLTTFGDLPTPRSWIRTPSTPAQRFSPALVLQTPPPQTKAQDEAAEPQYHSQNHADQPRAPIQDDSPELSNEQVQEPKIQVQTVNPPCRSPLNALDTPEAGNVHHVAIAPPVEANSNAHVEAERRKPMRELAGLPEVRRKLFCLDKEDERCDSRTKFLTRSNPDPSLSSAAIAAAGGDNASPGIKSRLAPPPPITVPGPSNTTPGGIYPISKTTKARDVATEEASETLKIVLPSLHAGQFPAPDVQSRDVPQQKKKVKRQQNLLAQQHKKKSRAKSEVEEKRPIMSERASLVLAEMRRQMSEVQSCATKTTIASGTDATNFLPYSAVVQVPPYSQKETERPVCNCKASQCIKRYCPCFATSNFCGKGCGCRNCENTTEYSSVVGRARRVLLERDPNAFVPRIRNTQRSSGRGRQTIRGCNCRKGCEKNYCICRENGLICGVRCTCSGPQGCQNYDESKLDEVPQVIENAPRSGYPSAAFDKPETLKVSRAEEMEAGMSNCSKKLHIEPAESNMQKPHHVDQENAPVDVSSPGLGPFDVLPTPTNPSLPNHRFFEGDPVSKKRTVTFENPMNSFKKIRVGDADRNILPELKQSSSKYHGYHYKTPPLEASAAASSFMGTPLTSRVLSADTPIANNNGVPWRRQSNDSNMIRGEGLGLDPSESRRMSYVPRIFRYKFGSGRNSGSFEFKS